MSIDGLILLGFIAALIVFVVVRLYYRLRCPSCREPARRMKIDIGFRVSQGKKKVVSSSAGTCPSCGHMWMLRNTHARIPGLITIPKGMALRR